MNEVAYTPEPLDNPNFISRPPDPGPLKLYATVGWDALYHSPFSGAYRSSELMLEKNPYFNVDGNTLTGEEATKKYGMGGQLKFDEPIKETAASLIAQRKMDENDRDYVIGSGETNSFRKATSIGVGMAASLLDPVNTASMFIPVVGEAKFAAMTAKYGGSVLKARLLKGAYQGLVGTAMVEPFVLLPNLQQQANYDIGDSALALGYGVGLGAFLHAGLGAFHDRLTRVSQNDRNAIFEAAMNNVLNDKPVTSPSRIAEFTEPAGPHTIETPHDSTRYQEIHVQMVEHIKAGTSESPEFRNLWQESEDIKNRNSSDPGMPPEAPPDVASVQPETIKSAAVQFPDGTVKEGPVHGGIHAEYTAELGAGMDGFVTSKGRFVTREEAAQIAYKNKQLPKEMTEMAQMSNDRVETPLASEDLRNGQLEQIPKRDPVTGKSLSKEQRLEMLQQQIADQKSRVKLQDENVHKDTQKDVTRLTTEEVRNTTETPKVLTEIQSEIPQLEKEAFPETVALDDEAKIEAEAERQNFEKDLEREIGDPKAREKGVNAGVNCINSNMI